jgi:hypothetical protein
MAKNIITGVLGADEQRARQKNINCEFISMTLKSKI